MTTLTPTLLQKREVLRTLFKQGIKPVDGRQPIPENLSQEMVQQLIDLDIDKNDRIGVIDTFLTLTLTLQEYGFTNIVVLENDHRSLTDLQEKYYNTIKGACEKIGVTYYVPPMNNYKRCDMKFDVIIGNPPYQDSSHRATKNSLWKEFLNTSLENSDFVSLIIPASFTSPAGRFQDIKDYLKFVSFNVKQHFKGIGVQFCRVVIDKNHVGPTTIESHTGEIFEIDMADHICLPETISPQLIEQSKSIFTNTREWKKTCEYHTQNKNKLFDKDGSIEILHGAVIHKTNSDHPNNSKIRIQCPTTKHPVFTVIQNKGLSQTHIWTEVSSIEEGEELCSWLNSDEVQSVLRQYKWSNIYFPQIIKQLG